MTANPRLAIVASHPIQHFCPQYASIAESAHCDLQVFFASRAGSGVYYDHLFGRDVQWGGLQLSRFSHTFVNGESAAPSSSTIDAPTLGEHLAAFDPSVVIVYGYSQRLQRRALRWAKANGKKVLLFADSELRQQRSIVKRTLKRAWLPAYFRKVDGFLTTGDANEEYYRHYGVAAQRMYRMPYPIDRELHETAFAKRAATRSRMREELAIDEGQLCCLTVGKFVPWKRQADAITVLAERAMDTVILILAGSGPDEASLRRLADRVAPGRVRFVGFVQPGALSSYYLAADVYLHPSEREPHSVAISEAIYLGTPAILSDRCGSYGPTDDVQHGRNGFVYPCGDIVALARYLRTLKDEPTLRAGFGASSRVIGERAQALAHGEGLRAALVGVRE